MIQCSICDMAKPPFLQGQAELFGFGNAFRALAKILLVWKRSCLSFCRTWLAGRLVEMNNVFVKASGSFFLTCCIQENILGWKKKSVEQHER